MSDLQQGLEQVAHADAFRVRKKKALAVLLRQVRQMVHGIDHVVHGHDIEQAGLVHGQRQPVRRNAGQVM